MTLEPNYLGYAHTVVNKHQRLHVLFRCIFHRVSNAVFTVLSHSWGLFLKRTRKAGGKCNPKLRLGHQETHFPLHSALWQFVHTDFSLYKSSMNTKLWEAFFKPLNHPSSPVLGCWTEILTGVLNVTLTTWPLEDFTPYMTGALFAIQHFATLTGNCSVMQHCTQMTFLSFFPHK